MTRDARAFLDSLLHAIPGFVLKIDRERRILFLSGAPAGSSVEQFLGRTLEEFVSEPSVAIECTARVIETGEPADYEIVGPGPNGETARYHVYVGPLELEDGTRGATLVALDVTKERVRDEQLRVATTATGIGLWWWDFKTGKVHWNAQMHAITGSPVPLDARDYLALVHPEDRDRIMRQMNDHLDLPRFESSAYRIVRLDGEIRWIITVGETLREGPNVAMLVGAAMDITAQRRRDELAGQRQKLEAVGQLAAGVAHNFNNMLAAILPTLEYVRPDLHGDRLDAVDDALHAARRAAELVRQLTTFARAPRATARLPHALGDIVQRAVAICRRAFQRSVQIEDHGTTGVPLVVRCDPGKLEQVVVNLLLNARDAIEDAGRSAGRVRIELTRSAEVDSLPGHAPGYARIRVVDDGVGMSEIVRARIFEPFFTTKAIGRGTGMGLATAFAIVEELGGRIGVESEAGYGTTIDVWVPLFEGEVSEIETRGPVSVPRGVGELVVIVDDELAIRRITSMVLEQAGYRVVLASSLPELRQRAQDVAGASLVLLDRSVVAASVKDVASCVKSIAPRASVAYFTGDDVPSSELGGISAVLVKPVSSERLLRSVRALLDGEPLPIE